MNELLFNAGGRHDYSGSFEKRTQLMVNCLRYIYQSNSFVTIVNLSERLNVNRKTTDSILNELQKSIRKQSKIKKSIRVLF